MPDSRPPDFYLTPGTFEWNWPNLPSASPLRTPATNISTHEPHTDGVNGTMADPPAPSAYPIPSTQAKDAAAGASLAPKIEPDAPRRISRAEWEQHRKVIENHHPFTTLTQLQNIMATKHGFIAR